MGSIVPSAERIAEFAAVPQDDGPIVMLNLLRYRDRAEYPPGSDASPCSGREAYQRYSEVAIQKVARVGGRVLWLGAAFLTLIGPEEEAWDDVVLVEYPSPRAFLRMVSMPEYQAVAFHRTAALVDSRLVATKAVLTTIGDGR